MDGPIESDSIETKVSKGIRWMDRLKNGKEAMEREQDKGKGGASHMERSRAGHKV
jgi:hypothetical protein